MKIDRSNTLHSNYNNLHKSHYINYIRLKMLSLKYFTVEHKKSHSKKNGFLNKNLIFTF